MADDTAPSRDLDPVAGAERADAVEASARRGKVRHRRRGLADLATTSPLPMIVLDRRGAVIEANHAARRLLGVPSGDSLRSDRPFVDDERTVDCLRRGKVIAGVEVTIIRADGSAVTMALYGAPIGDRADGAFGVTLVEPAGRGHPVPDPAPQWHGETLASFEAVLTSNPIALVLLDADFRVRVWNPAAQRLFGWTAEEVIGSQTPFVPPDLKPENAELRRKARERAEGVSDFETKRLRKDGSVIPVATYSTPILDGNGAMAGVVLGYIDLRERKRLEAELLEAQKMETVARLAGGVAHDFNNILTAVIGFSDIAQSMAEEADLVQVLATVKAGAERAAGLTRQLLAFSRQQVLHPQVIDPGEAVLAMEPILGRVLGDGIGLEIAISPEARPILVDRTQLGQVLLNLATNARDAMPSGGRLVIRVESALESAGALERARPRTARPKPVSREPARQSGEVPRGACTVISVADSGIGIDEVTRAHIFEPFFTTKGPGGGAGLGLSTTYGIITQSGGHVDVVSEPGKGTIFRLTFPVAIETSVELPPPQPVTDTPRVVRVLLVEDEPTVRDLAETILRRAGFQVHAAPDPAAALAFIAAGGAMDLLVTDVVMPGMTGTELARLLREQRRDLPVLFMSGYSEEASRDPGRTAHPLLAKPFTPAELRRAVDAAIEASPVSPAAPTAVGTPIHGGDTRR
jgi:two-component system, cell cycle sensor histidine kinase and response regulator CckA